MARVRVLIALAWLAATVGVPWTFGGRALNLGFVSAVVLAIAAAVSDWRTLKATLNRRVLAALGLGVLAFVVPALAHGFGIRLWLGVLRGCMVFAWLALLLAFGRARIKDSLLYAALALLIGNLLLAIGSVCAPAFFSAFEIANHEYVGGLPRLRGLANSPAPAGVWALVSLGLAEAAPSRRARWLARSLGLLEACASLSVPLLAVPALLASLLPRPAVRWLLVFAAAIFAAATLYFQPLELTVAGRHFTVSSEHPNYASEGFGPEYMQQKVLALPGLILRGHPTAYGELAARAATCFAEHPLAGVGPGRFREACRVMAMNTFGEWTDQRDSHNQLGGLAAELGVVGLAFLCCAWLVLRRDYAFEPLTTWQGAVWVGLLVCGLGSEDLLTLPVLALLASQLTRVRRQVP